MKTKKSSKIKKIVGNKKLTKKKKTAKAKRILRATKIKKPKPKTASLRKSAKKNVKKSARSQKTRVPKPRNAKPVGKVTHFFGNIHVAIVKFNQNIRAGTELYFKGATTDFKEIVKSMQYNHIPIITAQKGKAIGIKVKKRVREGDAVYHAR